jgi:glycosyltransferase involved in cell wall biosynthesis
MSYPKISIVTPSFNQGEFIEETILSVIGQKYPNLEYIIIDGGSSDNSVDIIKKYEKFITYWVSEPDTGHANALNKGFAMATGEIMAWINSDDKYFEWTFKTIAETYTKFSDIEWTVGLHSNFDRRGVLMAGKENVRAIYRNMYSYIFGDLHIQQESVFWRRSLWERCGSRISEDVHLMVDTELWCRFFLEADIWHIDQVIGGYRTYGLNRSHTNEEKVKDDINFSVSNLLYNLPIEKKNILENIKKYSFEYKLYNSIIKKNSDSLRENIFLRLLPYFIYEKIVNYLFKKIIEIKKIKEPIKPIDSSFCFKKIKFISGHWQKEYLPYNFPY